MNLKIRSITAGIDYNGKNISEIEKKIGRFFELSDKLFEKNNIEVRTHRLNLPPFKLEDINANENIDSIVEWVSTLCKKNDIRWFCVPFNVLSSNLREINTIAIEIAKRYKNSFINFILAEEGRINREAILSTSKFIKAVSRLSNNGYDNFRIGASFNCKPNGAFFPFTYQDGNDGFSLALEMVPIFIKNIEDNLNSDLMTIRDRLIDKIVPKLQNIQTVCREIEDSIGMEFYGIDASLAPFPDGENNSVAKIVELLGVDAFGSSGTVFITSFLTDTIKSILSGSKIKPIGFNGVMYSLLEDSRLGINNNSKEFSIDSLLAFSSVCGCGLDMVPIPGDVFEEEIGSLMLDIAAMSSILHKPLGLRILPIPFKHANEFTDFSYDFLYNTRIKSVKNRACRNEFFQFPEPFTYTINS